LSEQIVDVEIKRNEAVRELWQLINYERGRKHLDSA